MNYTTSPLQTLSECIAHAQYEGFSDIEYDKKDWTHFRDTGEEKYTKMTRRPTAQDFEVYAMFPQTWGSTALGFGGIGGSAMTTAYTVVLHSNYYHEFLVYFGGTFAYKVNGRSKNFEKFRDDINQQNLSDQRSSGKYQ